MTVRIYDSTPLSLVGFMEAAQTVSHTKTKTFI